MLLLGGRVTDADGVPAQPGDLLMVELCNLGPLPGDEWGFTGGWVTHRRSREWCGVVRRGRLSERKQKVCRRGETGCGSDWDNLDVGVGAHESASLGASSGGHPL
jgi:hypothetical protein